MFILSYPTYIIPSYNMSNSFQKHIDPISTSLTRTNNNLCENWIASLFLYPSNTHLYLNKGQLKDKTNIMVSYYQEMAYSLYLTYPVIWLFFYNTIEKIQSKSSSCLSWHIQNVTYFEGMAFLFNKQVELLVVWVLNNVLNGAE